MQYTIITLICLLYILLSVFNHLCARSNLFEIPFSLACVQSKSSPGQGMTSDFRQGACGGSACALRQHEGCKRSREAVSRRCESVDGHRRRLRQSWRLYLRQRASCCSCGLLWSRPLSSPDLAKEKVRSCEEEIVT